VAEIELPSWAKRLWEPSRFKAMYGGRGAGKSRSVASALVLMAAEKPERILCAREVQNSIKDSVKRLLDDEVERMGLTSFFTTTEREIRGRNGSLFIFAGLRGNAAGIKSLEGVTKAWVEEAQTISQGSLDTLVPTIRAPGSELWFTWNPDLATDPIDAMFRGETQPPGTMLLPVGYQDNPWFPDELRVSMEYDRTRDLDKYLHVWEGKYRQNSEARVFKNWTVDSALSAPAGAEFRLGADFGFSIDPSCALRCWIEGKRICIDYEAWGLGVEIVNLPNLFMEIPEAEKWWLTADSSRPETISHLRTNGFPRIRPALKGARSVEEGVEWLKSYDIIVHPRCQHLIDELTMYSYKTDSLTGDVLPVLEDKNNHMIDALRYACEGARRALAGKPETTTFYVPSLARS
jgi:phage terminase large subunit